MGVEKENQNVQELAEDRTVLRRLLADLSKARNPLVYLEVHLRDLAKVLGYPCAALYLVPETDEEHVSDAIARWGDIDLEPEALVALPPLKPEFVGGVASPALLLVPIVFGDQAIAIIALTGMGLEPPSQARLLELEDYGRLVAPSIERAALRHRLGESEKLLHARSLGEMRAVRAVQTANTMRQEAEEKLLHAAFHDTLTGLANRTLFMDRLAHALRRAERSPGMLFGILCIGVDRFKVINDSLGHSAGDEILLSVARRLERTIRPSDTLARLGGDEFTVLLEDIGNLRRANRVRERIQSALERAFPLDNQEIVITASVGIALSTGPREAGDLLRDAELAMHRAKARGRGETEVFDVEMHSSAMALLELETDLRGGLERNEFRVYYQPVYELATNSLQGFEALVRWEHPRRGLLAPGAFLEVAEESGLIVPLGSWVLQETCRQLAEWVTIPNAPDGLSVSVNLSDRQMHRPNLPQEIFEVIDASGLPRERVALEITENLMMEHADQAEAALSRLNEGGIHLHLDDFGTGYSSLSYLRRLPLNTLKIDRSFVSRIGAEREDRAVVQAIVMLARGLNLSVIAEGIETEAQLQVIKDLGCEFGQGYFFARPLPPDQASELVRGG
ncbi:MAG: bifunctional diguanylate cyclase/phosphodiesterase [Myxococcota bacterium]|nr:bifunctional diguanylate cyclase/phosphodiesterase [Myxococcota bacterium]